MKRKEENTLGDFMLNVLQGVLEGGRGRCVMHNVPPVVTGKDDLGQYHTRGRRERIVWRRFAL